MMMIMNNSEKNNNSKFRDRLKFSCMLQKASLARCIITMTF